MKLSLLIATAIAGLLYAIAVTVAPDFPVTPDQLLQIVIFLLSLFGVVVTEEQVRAFFVRKGFTGFIKRKE